MIEIKELILRVPNLSPDQANALAAEVAERLAVALPRNVASQNLENLNIKLTLSENAHPGQMANAITHAIRNAIGVKAKGPAQQTAMNKQSNSR